MRFGKLMALALAALMLLGGCRRSEKEPSGEPVHIRDLAVCGDQAWHLFQEDGTLTLIRDGVTVKEIPDAAGPRFDAAGNACWYREDGTLVRYALADGNIQKIGSAEMAPLIITGRYALLGGGKSAVHRLDLADGTVAELKNLPQSFRLLATQGDLIYMDHYARRTISVYDAAGDTLTDLWQYESDRQPLMTGAVLDGALYFAGTGGGLWRLDLESAGAEPIQVSKKTPVAMTAGEAELICALKEHEDDLGFCVGVDRDAPVELARWEKSGYFLNGSCLLTVSGGKGACAVTTGTDVFEFKLN